MKAVIQTQKDSWLKEAFNEKSEELGASLMKLNFEEKEIYLRWMAQHYHLVRHTMRYICLAAGLSDCNDEASYSYWARALKGEHNHHKLLENDAKFLGVSLSTYDVGLAPKQIVSVVKNDMIESNGCALFGYALLLEGMSCTVGEKFKNRIISAYGKKAATFLSVHSDADDGEDGHFNLGKQFIENHYSDFMKEKILATLIKSHILYEDLINSIAAN